MKKRAIPQPTANQIDINRAVKENLEQIMGQRPLNSALEPLASTATLDDVIAKVNQIIERMQ